MTAEEWQRESHRASWMAHNLLLPSGRLHPQWLAVLAAALEEAGAVGDLLDHLRGPEPHMRGCHVTDTILRKSRTLRPGTEVGRP
jgi:hypothetical protein